MAEAKKGHVMRCHYEVMEVERDATDDQLKQKYRKLALKWHPDKNAENLDEATERFKEITNAYTTLSDPNERSWYDSHREQILRGGTGARGDEGDDDNEGCGINLFPFFSSSCYTGYGDDEGGFYQVFEQVFQDIHDLEVDEDADAGAPPSLGGPTTVWTDGPGQFYSFYEGFSSRRSFSWCDKYNPNEAPNRQVKRAIDKENGKERNRGKRAFNETVRRLASWVKKRDPRQLAHQQRVAEEATRKAEEDRLKQIEMKRLREEAKEREKGEEIEVDEAMDDMYMEMELIKGFRGKKGKKLREQLLAQEAEALAQKKEAEAKAKGRKVEAEGREGSDDDEDASLEESDEESGEEASEEEEEEEEEEEDSVLAQLAKAKEKKNRKKTKGRQSALAQAEEEEEEEEEEEDSGVSAVTKNAAKDKGEEEEEEDDDDDDSLLLQLAKAREKKKKKSKAGRGPAAILSSEEEDDDEDEDEDEEDAPSGAHESSVSHADNRDGNGSDGEGEVGELIRELVDMGFSENQAKVAVKECGDLDGALGFLMAQGDDDQGGFEAKKTDDKQAEAPKKLTGKKAKDARKLKAEEAAKAKAAEGGGAGEHACNVCNEKFASRSKLFSHIKDTGHALYDPKNPASMPKQMKGKKKK